MDFYLSLLQKSKEEGIEKNVIGSVIFNNENKALILTRNNEDFMGGIDEIPSGNIEVNETIKEALYRETKEETNLDIEEISEYINSMDYISSSGKKARQHNFLVKVKDLNASIVLSEHSKYKWQSIEEILSNSKITSETKFIFEILRFNKRR